MMLRTAGLLASPKEALSAGFGFRRRPATRLLDHYRDRTFTGKPNGAYLDTPEPPPYRCAFGGQILGSTRRDRFVASILEPTRGRGWAGIENRSASTMAASADWTGPN